MPERDLVITDLVAEVLGPRSGPTEVLASDEDPVDEYITGVLAPHTSSPLADDAQDQSIGHQSTSADDESDAGDDVPGVNLSGLPNPSLDPRARPASLGISFVVAGGSPTVDLACTWARYFRSSGGTWLRHPYGQVWSNVSCTSPSSFDASSDGGVRIQVRCRQDGQVWRISVFLINITQITDRPQTEDYLFQPQIRVVVGSGSRALPLDQGQTSTHPEDRSLALLYSGHAAYARGHLCAAMWRDIDPERQSSQPSPQRLPPFHWADGEHLFDSVTFARFAIADVRSEYVPIVPVGAPEMEWSSSIAPPLLDPEKLSELWDAKALKAALDPFAMGYEQWINQQLGKCTHLSPEEAAIAHQHLANCGAALVRIKAGINLLSSDPDARLAFCFANKAIALQSRWAKGKVNAWRPFQLAFQLMNLKGVADPGAQDRNICDLLWFPTGGGKTEAYLGLAAFVLGLRRLKALRKGTPVEGAGVSVLSRYTLRLLTIQQFRRTLNLITACEFLRVIRVGGLQGWRPSSCRDNSPQLWGPIRFSLGLWVGGSITPNSHQDFQYVDRNRRPHTIPGALSILLGRGQGDGEPAQVLTCPVCGSTLALPPQGYSKDQRGTLHFVLADATTQIAPLAKDITVPPFQVTDTQVTFHNNSRFCTLRVDFSVTTDAGPDAVDKWFRASVAPSMGPDTWLVAAHASRPGYFIHDVRLKRSEKPFEFEIYCPNHECELNNGVEWSETTPSGQWAPIEAFLAKPGISSRCPIPAWTIDEQVYHRCPSMVIATVDKFARLAYDPRAGAIFGNVDRFSLPLGYYRSWCPPRAHAGLPTHPEADAPLPPVSVNRFMPPDLIIQDELHLIEGPLGTMVGLYETAVETLASRIMGTSCCRAKYIASTATIRQANEQVKSLYDRELAVFPHPGVSIDDSFFARTSPLHPLEDKERSRIYIGICAPGRGAQTPIVRIWSRLLQHAADRLAAGAPASEIDRFWTLVGYFNALRELAGAVALSRQDIIQRLGTISNTSRRLDEADPLELSSNTNPLQLPALLRQLEDSLTARTTPVNSAVATSMFGTGVDVDRLGLMVVHGQPKATSGYIQATGRVGRAKGGCVVTFYRAARPRDLNHYEFFTAYHNALYRYVEPITVHPFSPRARDRALGPVSVSILRQSDQLPSSLPGVPVSPRWRVQQRLEGRGQWFCLAHEMASARHDPDVRAVADILEARSQKQPGLRQPVPSTTKSEADSELDRWAHLGARLGSMLLYYEPTLINTPTHPVVLGDLDHLVAGLDVAFEDAPNSLREVEATTTFKGWW